MNLAATRAGRRVLFAALYFSEGAPIGFVWWALPTKLREAGVEVGTITSLIAILALPWGLKFLWAPLIDLGGGRHRRWIVACQLLMGITLLPLAFVSWDQGVGWIFPLLVAHALAASTQDAAIDAYAIAVTPAAERGTLTAAMQAGMLGGRWLFGAGLLIAAAAIGTRQAVLGMVVAFALAATLVGFSRDADPTESSRQSGLQFRRAVVEVLRGRRWWLGLALALLGGAAFEAVGALAGPFLVDHNYSSTQAGMFFSVTVVLMAAGAVAGGWTTDRLGPRRAAAVFLVVLAVLVASAAALDRTGSGLAIGALAAVYLGIGLFTAASYALFMNLTDPRLAGTQFSAYMGATNLCEAWAAFLAGRLIAPVGYPGAFLAMAVLSLPALLALRALRGHDSPQARDQ